MRSGESNRTSELRFLGHFFLFVFRATQICQCSSQPNTRSRPLRTRHASSSPRPPQPPPRQTRRRRHCQPNHRPHQSTRQKLKRRRRPQLRQTRMSMTRENRRFKQTSRLSTFESRRAIGRPADKPMQAFSCFAVAEREIKANLRSMRSIIAFKKNTKKAIRVRKSTLQTSIL